MKHSFVFCPLWFVILYYIDTKFRRGEITKSMQIFTESRRPETMLWSKLLQMWHWTVLEQTMSEKILFARNTCTYVDNTCFTACSWKMPVRDLHTELASLLTRVIRVYKLHFHIYGHCCACMSKLPVFRSRPVLRPGAQFNVNQTVAYCSSVRKHVPPKGLFGFGLAHPRLHAVARLCSIIKKHNERRYDEYFPHITCMIPYI